MISSTKLIKAIRKKCLDCSGEQLNEVLNCETLECPIYPYRLGLNYNTDSKKKGNKK